MLGGLPLGTPGSRFPPTATSRSDSGEDRPPALLNGASPATDDTSMSCLARGWVVLLLVTITAACSAGPPKRQSPSPTFVSGAAAASRFARAWVQQDYSMAIALVCPGTPRPRQFDASMRGDPSIATVEDARLTGPPTKGHTSGIQVIRADFHVPFEGTVDGKTVPGSVAVTLGGTPRGPCVRSYGAGLDKLPSPRR